MKSDNELNKQQSHDKHERVLINKLASLEGERWI